MIKSLFTVSFLLFCFQFSFANKVDDLKTDADVRKFILSVDTNLFNPKYTENFVIPSTEYIVNDKNCDSGVKKYEVQNWVKADFNNDGRTDLLVIAYWSNYFNLIAIDKGNNTFQLININYSIFNECELINTVRQKDQQLVLFHTTKLISNIPESFAGKNTAETDTLIYKFNGFVNLNNKPANLSIDSVTFFTGPCFGSCPTAEIKFDKIGHAIYTAGMFSKKQGTFTGTIKIRDLDRIFNLVNYMDIKSLKDKYYVNWSDDVTCSVRIKFSDGTVKSISDYGKRGTFSLQQLYSLLFDLTISQNWVASK